MADRVINNPIINSPFRPPTRHFKFDSDGITNHIEQGWRPSSYFVPVPRPRKQAQLEFAELTADEIELNQQVNAIRQKVDLWRQRGYPHVTPTTRRLLEYWCDEERDNPILFCQREAAETAIYIAEAAQKDSEAWIRNELDEANGEQRWPVPTRPEDGDRLRQDRRDGDGHRVADAEQGGKSERQLATGRAVPRCPRRTGSSGPAW